MKTICISKFIDYFNIKKLNDFNKRGQKINTTKSHLY